jgi:hypothetical protein
MLVPSKDTGSPEVMLTKDYRFESYYHNPELMRLLLYFIFMRGKITVTPDGFIKALDVNKQEYVYLPNKLVDEYGECPLFIE